MNNLSDDALDVIEFITSTSDIEGVYNTRDIALLCREVRRHRQMLIRDRRTAERVFCGFRDCNLSVGHGGSHRGPCGCTSGCLAWDCANV